MNKTKIIKSLFATQDQVIIGLRERVKNNKVLVDLDETDTNDMGDYSHQDEVAEMNGLMDLQLEKAEAEKLKLRSIDFSHKTKIGVGAVVKTDHYTFVIGIATLSFKVDGIQCVGISLDAPIYGMMKDKKVGESFSFGGNSYKIKSIE